ncbi:unnamed protein product [Prorocentrum cordatum]|uniref:Uncharacterized protein n=1 Tax=Prorocentrum cordatum TaxID=2364126 RepID=A0ABN9QMN6_9DINO|nr:unnamed protein product [Polarella glacialis]
MGPRKYSMKPSEIGTHAIGTPQERVGVVALTADLLRACRAAADPLAVLRAHTELPCAAGVRVGVGPGKTTHATATEKHPIFLSARAEPPAVSRQWIFGRGAFVECLLKIAFLHLGYHGTAEQSAQPSLSKAVWLLLFLHWQFDSVKGHLPALTRKAAGAAEGEGEERAAPTHVPPLWRLVRRHPRLFLDYPVAPPCDMLPMSSQRPATAPCGSAQCGGGQPQHGWGSAGCPRCCQADTVATGALDEGPPLATGLTSLDRIMLNLSVGAQASV